MSSNLTAESRSLAEEESVEKASSRKGKSTEENTPTADVKEENQMADVSEVPREKKSDQGESANLPVDKFDLNALVKSLCQTNAILVRKVNRAPCAEPLPSFDVVQNIVEALRAVLFPGFSGQAEVTPQTLQFHIGHRLDWIQRELEQQVKRSLAFACTDTTCLNECSGKAREITKVFLERVPAIQHLLASDVIAAYEGDPAAPSPDEAIFSYPGLRAVTNYRIAHELHQLEVPVLPRMMTEYAHSVTGIDIHPGAQIDGSFFIDHGTGVVIGETCIIGKRVRIYQGVTLGAKSFPLDEQGNPIKGIPRHPIIEDDVIIYSGATILGRVTIGRGSMVGGNVFLLRSVPAGSKVVLHPPKFEVFKNGQGI